MLVHDITRLTEVAGFIEEEKSGTTKSGWFLDFFSTKRRTRAEKLEFRKYSKTRAKPLLYTGACLPPNMISRRTESLTVSDFSFPVIKAEGQITACDVDEKRILPDGTIIPVGIQRFNNALNWEMLGLTDGLRETHIAEAITVMKTGGYILHSSDDENMGTVDFNREDTLKNIDLSDTSASWNNLCGNPLDAIEAVVTEMRRVKASAGVIDIIHSRYSWSWMKAYDDRTGIKFDKTPMFGSGFDATPFFEYDDVEFKGTSNGGIYRHWVSDAKYQNHEGEEVDVIDAGEIMIVSKTGLNLQRVFRTITSDNKEALPAGADFFVYDDLEREYDRKRRAFNPWIEEYHLMVPSNVNGAVLMRVVAEDAGEPCVACEKCPEL